MSTSTSKQKTKVSNRKYARSKILIAGGGTGGHIFPAIAIANAIKAIDSSVKIMFVGANGKMEMDKVPAAGYHISGLTISGFNRKSLLKNITLPFKLIKSFLEVKKIFKKFEPTEVIGVGGYSTYPVLRYAQGKGIPTFIHESNSFAGKSNVLLGKRATKIFVASEGMDKFFPKEKIQITGNPVRKSIIDSTITREEAITFFGLKEEKQTVLIIGGSLGAKSINEALASSIDKLGEAGLQLVWQMGKNDPHRYRRKTKGKDFVWMSEFITRMDMAYAAADIVISRAGAMAVTELCVVGKPSIFVPYPYAAEDHQTANAIVLVEKKAALLVKDSDASEKLVDTVIALAKDFTLRNELKKNISSLAITTADEVIAREILTPIP
jgi:UDP-N-acetylglucosamine--N-acetylmuramyl-(pentapeptide) pyrophosphoryl-undecaprenol N-acetylglucosamine transferase